MPICARVADVAGVIRARCSVRSALSGLLPIGSVCRRGQLALLTA